MWQCVLTPQQCLLAEQKLNCWLIKPQTAFLQEQIADYPYQSAARQRSASRAHPVLELVAVGFLIAGGVFYAFGGYLNMLTGALLGLFASILDGCDGEVARLKLQESDIGCWLETICDYLYYLFTFAGMAIGLFRSSGQRSYLVWGGLLLLVRWQLPHHWAPAAPANQRTS
jgi:hypothetical protein